MQVSKVKEGRFIDDENISLNTYRYKNYDLTSKYYQILVPRKNSKSAAISASSSYVFSQE